ncbi:MAG: ribonuclease HII [Candidatus Saccharibacteria bacterium]|nr:ribonuclease HII [Candidatus Saccharibacteria bacterium]
MAILGIDEVGRGPLAGPLVVGAVILPEKKPEWVDDLRDSKKLSAKKRGVLNEVILAEAVATGLGWVSPVEIDELGMNEALKLAVRRAIEAMRGSGASFSQIIIDGKVNFLKGTALEGRVSTMPKADDLIKEVSAASIIAKVARDRYMCEVAEKYPEYGFEKNVGYGTVLHREAIMRLGICPEHRRSFEPIRSMVGFERPSKGVVKNTTAVGNRAEEKVAEYLVCEGHRIVARNFKTYFYEIDIVSTKGDKVYFTEVKYRKSDIAGGGIAAIDKKKLQRMKFAAECFMKYHAREMADYSPLLAVADVVGEDFVVRAWFSLD